MTLQEALRSGRRIRNCDVGKCVWFDPGNELQWRVYYVLSDKWEVEPLPKKKETRWLWADEAGVITDCMYSTAPRDFPIKLEWSATEFEVD